MSKTDSELLQDALKVIENQTTVIIKLMDRLDKTERRLELASVELSKLRGE